MWSSACCVFVVRGPESRKFLRNSGFETLISYLNISYHMRGVYLFIMVMTMLMRDAQALLGVEAHAALIDGTLSDLLYADDTLIMGVSAEIVSEYGRAVETAGKTYGMALHWGKTQALSICTSERLRRPDGTVIHESGSLEYFGGVANWRWAR